MKNVAYIKIGAPRNTYALVVPNLTQESMRNLIQDAKERALAEPKPTNDPLYAPPTFIFAFADEDLRIEEHALFIHSFIKNENFPYDTPSISVHSRG